jgi:hypothetical protein
MSTPSRIARWGGPALVVGLLLAAVINPLLVTKPGPASAGGCTAKPDTVRAVTADPMLTQHPASTDLEKAAEESLNCGDSSSPGSSVIQVLAAGVIGARLSSPPGINVSSFYSDLARRSGWQADERPTGLFSATKPTGDCPWWFVLNQAKDGGYHLRVYYQPDGAPADSCAWESGDAYLLPLTAGN